MVLEKWFVSQMRSTMERRPSPSISRMLKHKRPIASASFLSASSLILLSVAASLVFDGNSTRVGQST